VPAFTDLDVWDGHQTWTPPDPSRPVEAAAFFGDQMPPAHARAFLLSTHVRWVLADCPDAAATIARLEPAITRVQRFGCAEVAEVK
jgi:hypothetical protein